MEIGVKQLAEILNAAWREGYDARTREELENAYRNQAAQVPEPPKRGRPRKAAAQGYESLRQTPVGFSGIKFQDSKDWPKDDLTVQEKGVE